MAFKLHFRASEFDKTDGTALPSVTINKPAGTIDGDIITMVLVNGGDPYWLAGTSFYGFDNVNNFELAYIAGDGPGSTAIVYAVYQKIAASEPASWTWEFEPWDGFSGATIPAVGLYVVTWEPDALAANETYPLGVGPGWVETNTGVSFLDKPGPPVGFQSTGNRPDAPNPPNYVDHYTTNFLAAIETARGTTTGAAHAPETFTNVTSDATYLEPDEMLLPNADFGGGVETQSRWSDLGVDENGTFLLEADLAGGSGATGYLSGFAIQGWILNDAGGGDSDAWGIAN